MTKIDVFSGFLGAGKTTLIKKLLKEAYNAEKVVLIENEFGEIGIDGAFLKDAGIEITEMNSGCICCSLVGDFSEALKKVLDEFHPQRILIEPSGVGKLSDVVKAIENIGSDEIVLNARATVVDVNKCKMYMKNFGEFFNDQISNASSIILSHSENVSSEKIESCIGLLREHNADAKIIATAWDEIDGKTILSAMENGKSISEELSELERELHEHHHHHDEECDCHEHHHHHGEGCDCHEHHHHHGEECDCHEHHHHHDEECDCREHHHHHGKECDCHEHHHHAEDVFTSWGCETSKKFSAEQIKTILGTLSSNEYGVVLRAKGLLPQENGEWIYFDYIPNETDIRTGRPEVIGRVCVIGSKIDEKKIAELFNA